MLVGIKQVGYLDQYSIFFVRRGSFVFGVALLLLFGYFVIALNVVSLSRSGIFARNEVEQRMRLDIADAY